MGLRCRADELIRLIDATARALLGEGNHRNTTTSFRQYGKEASHTIRSLSANMITSRRVPLLQLPTTRRGTSVTKQYKEELHRSESHAWVRMGAALYKLAQGRVSYKGLVSSPLKVT